MLSLTSRLKMVNIQTLEKMENFTTLKQFKVIFSIESHVLENYFRAFCCLNQMLRIDLCSNPPPFNKKFSTHFVIVNLMPNHQSSQTANHTHWIGDKVRKTAHKTAMIKRLVFSHHPK